jgi:hypothetical protein
MKCTGPVASYTKSGHSYHILFVCISVVAIIIITTIILGEFYIVRVYGISEGITRHISIGTYLPHTSVGTSHLHFVCHLIVTRVLRL